MLIRTPILTVFLTAALILVGAQAATARDSGLVSSLDLSRDQIEKLGAIVEDFNARKLAVEAKIDRKRMELAQELKKSDRWESEKKLKASAKVVNRLVRGLATLDGDLLKVRVAYFLKAKDVFTDDQRMIILGALTEYDFNLPEGFSYYLELDLPALDLDLTSPQIKKLLKYRADMDIRGIKYELDLEYRILDLQDELLSPKRDPKRVNRLITSIVDTGTKIIENKVNHILKAKDVLTLEQKMTLFHMMLMGAH